MKRFRIEAAIGHIHQWTYALPSLLACSLPAHSTIPQRVSRHLFWLLLKDEVGVLRPSGEKQQPRGKNEAESTDLHFFA